MSCSPTVEGKYDIEGVKGKPFPLGMVGGVVFETEERERKSGN